MSSYDTPPNLHELGLAIPFIVIGAIILAVTAQSWINFLLRGDQGLGAFLSDGSGYNKSGFKPRNKKGAEDSAVSDDPMPWLKLPQFDYVDVAGQTKKPTKAKVEASLNENKAQVDTQVVSKMENLKEQMKIKVQEGDLAEAKKIEMELETIMKKEGYEYSKSFE